MDSTSLGEIPNDQAFQKIEETLVDICNILDKIHPHHHEENGAVEAADEAED